MTAARIGYRTNPYSTKWSAGDDVGDRREIVHGRAEHAETRQSIAAATLGEFIETPDEISDQSLVPRSRR